MNNVLLQLKGTFHDKPNTSGGGMRPSLKKDKRVLSSHLRKLSHDLEIIADEWADGKYYIPGVLVSIFYCDIVPKSSRIQATFPKPMDSVVGARFSEEEPCSHIITHYVRHKDIAEAIRLYNVSANLLDDYFDGCMTKQFMGKPYIESLQLDFKKSYNISESKFLKIIVDAEYITKFGHYVSNEPLEENTLVSFFPTTEIGTVTQRIEFLSKIGIKASRINFMDVDTLLLSRSEVEQLKEIFPYIISMAVSDLNDVPREEDWGATEGGLSICSPKNEPTIGVIDTQFSPDVYFSEWVEYHDWTDVTVEGTDADCFHGTAVSSIIVDGPSFNEKYDDGCGHFKVRHFAVAGAGRTSTLMMMKNIRNIVATNRDIKVWNLSLGSTKSVSKNFISPEAAVLDELQYEYDVVFVVSGTNKGVSQKAFRIGSPADSINSIVVNAVNESNQPASYSRYGPVLSFFIKPDIAYYGGDKGDLMTVCTRSGGAYVMGTSFAAPWIARKMSYMIDVLGMDRNVAKALLIQSATPWRAGEDKSELLGHGIPPIKISDIIESPSDEIRFVLMGISDLYDTYNYQLPIPRDNDKHPFLVKATMCYFPKCSRKQGVDYTNTEFDFSLGRIKDKKLQSTARALYMKENQLRGKLRKWDNVKILKDEETSRNKAKQAYDDGLWGISIKTMERLNNDDGKGMPFGVVVSLKALDKKNRIDDFIKACNLAGWRVHRIEEKSRIELFNKAEETLHFD